METQGRDVELSNEGKRVSKVLEKPTKLEWGRQNNGLQDVRV